MSQIFEPSLLSEDKPIVQPAEDRLGYASFAQMLAESMATLRPSRGVVFGLYGPWGAGKTTLLNFVKYYVEHSSQAEDWIILNFNPWWFSGREDLTRNFFDQLLAILNARKVGGQKLRKSIADLADVVAEVPIPYASSAKAVSKLAAVRQQSVPELKEEIAQALRKHKKNFLIIVDDIDRLDSEEIRQLFRVIKVVADFPQTAYLLAFDRNVAVRALEEAGIISGEAFLEKIVQVPFELPVPDKISLRRLLFERLDAILFRTPQEAFDHNYWANVYHEGIDFFIKTPRDVVRLINTLSVTYRPGLEAEVNPVDFIAIEALRVFVPTIYDIIRNNIGSFAGVFSSSHLSGTRPEDARPMFDAWLGELPEEDREPTKALLMRIFPKIEAVWSNMHYGPESLNRWRKQLRVASPDRFPVYFRFAVPEGAISNAEMKAFLSVTCDSAVFSAELRKLTGQRRPDGLSRVRVFLEQLEDYTPREIKDECIPAILKALFDVGDEITSADEPRGWFDLGNDLQIGRIVWQLQKRIEQTERFELLRNIFENGLAIATIIRELEIFGQQHGKYGETQPDLESERIVNSEQLAELEKIGLSRIRQVAEQGNLLSIPRFISFLHRWGEWGNEDEPKSWLRKQIETDSGLMVLLETLLTQSTVHSAGDVAPRKYERLDPNWLSPFLDPSTLVERIKHLATSDGLTERQLRAAAQFIREFNLRQEGKDPSRWSQLEDE